MKYTAAIATFLGVVAAVPNGIIDLGDGVKLVPREPRAKARVERLRNFRRGLMEVDGSEAELVGSGKNVSQVSYSTNWAGAVQIGTGYDDITGTIVVPTPSVPDGGSSTKKYAASAWVGIDGDTCSTAILQTGVDFYAGRGGVSFGESFLKDILPFPFPPPLSSFPINPSPSPPRKENGRPKLTRTARPIQMPGTSGTLTTPTTSLASPSPPVTQSP